MLTGWPMPSSTTVTRPRTRAANRRTPAAIRCRPDALADPQAVIRIPATAMGSEAGEMMPGSEPSRLCPP